MQRLLPDEKYIINPQALPDAKWFAYVQERNVFVESLPPGRGKWQISRNYGTVPRWRGDGREVYF